MEEYSNRIEVHYLDGSIEVIRSKFELSEIIERDHVFWIDGVDGFGHFTVVSLENMKKIVQKES